MEDTTTAMQLTGLSLTAFTDALAAGTAAPGGGAATALAGALGAALVGMVGRLTMDRPRYAEVAAEMARICRQADALRERLLGLMDADSRAYAGLMAAYGLPKGNADAEARRAHARQAALREATAVPLATAAACAEALALAAQAAALGNRNATGDAVAAALLAHAGLTGAAHNVRINLRGIADLTFREQALARIDDLLAAGATALAATLRAAADRT